jgi:hypothetical protein
VTNKSAGGPSTAADPDDAVGPGFPAFAALLALAIFVLSHWKGIWVNSDGWAMWQGAVSLAESRGYTYFSDRPIVSWPPLYSTYLAIWMAILGPTGKALLAANGLLIAVQGCFWCLLVRTAAGREFDALPTSRRMLLAAFIATFIARNQQEVLAQNLLYALVPLLFASACRLNSSSDDGVRRAWLIASILCATLIMLSHSMGVAFILSAAAGLLIFSTSRIRALIEAMLIVVVPLLAAVLSRLTFDQSDSHLAGWGAGKYAAWDYACQLLQGLGALIAPDRGGLCALIGLGLLLVAVVAIGLSKVQLLRFGLAGLLMSTIVVFALFCMTWIYNPLSNSQYILFLPLGLIPLCFITAYGIAPRAATVVLLAIVALQTYRAATWVVWHYHEDVAEPGIGNDPLRGFVPPEAYIERTYRQGPPLRGEFGILLAPTLHEERRLRSK